MSDITAVTLYEQAKDLARGLTGEEKAKLIRWLQVQIDLESVAHIPPAPGYPDGWFERTYGALADDPIERPPQPTIAETDERESLD